MGRLEITGAAGALRGWVLLLTLACAGGSVNARERVTTGADEFRISCASCHGLDGKGNGKLASLLTPRPTDLTTLAKLNNGRFPRAGVHRIIDGREAFYAHGERTMPVWGIRYLLEYAVRYGDDDSERVVRGRIEKLVDYIQSIQE